MKSGDKLLFTPGPLTTRRSVKEAMLRDLGSRDEDFIQVIAEVRRELLALGQVSREKGYEAILMQGSGTFGIESVIGSVLPRSGKLLVLINGAYGRRILTIAKRLGIETAAIEARENEALDKGRLDETLRSDPSITHVALVHCETTSGILNPVEAIGGIVAASGRTYIVDAMSSFGGVALDVRAARIDYLISSSNKCVEGVPGFSFVIANRANLLATRGSARSVSLDLLDQWESMEKSGQFRFTPPTHTLLAFHQALRELAAEGGIPARTRRYQENHATLVAGMRALGFVEYVDPSLQGWIITSFLYPTDPNFNFEGFYEHLSRKGMVIYPGKLTEADCFRIGNIGQISPDDVTALLGAISTVTQEMDVSLG
jgi:2-aminoethylphosphonate-pyruvate transaminase